jgi:hypothetical protein
MKASGSPATLTKKRDPGVVTRDLPERRKEEGTWRLSHIEILTVLRHPHYREPFAFALHSAAERLAAIKVPPRERLVDDHHQRRRPVIAITEIPPFDQRIPEQVKVMRRHKKAVNVHRLALAADISLRLHVAVRSAGRTQWRVIRRLVILVLVAVMGRVFLP